MRYHEGLYNGFRRYIKERITFLHIAYKFIETIYSVANKYQ